MKSKSEMAINLEGAGTTDYIMKQSNYRLLICQLKGVKKLILFTPNQGKYLYLDKTGCKSGISFWTDDLLQYPKLKKTQCRSCFISRTNDLHPIPGIGHH